ncbi:MAG: T9SS type A sorting domain-containing protein [Chitinophagales bacterium]|nr:T9SS type A sorting domain-containing protein [Chitinophagales bacterium]
MRIVVVYLLMAFIVGTANAQSNFHSRVSFDSIPYGLALGVGYVDSSCYFWGTYIRTTAMWETGKLFIGECKPNGEFGLVNPFLFLAEDTVYLPSQPAPLIYINKNIYLSGFQNDTNENYGAVMYKYNTETGGLLKVVYDSDTVEGYDYLTYDGNDGLYALGVTVNESLTYSNLLVSKYDTALNKIWDFLWESGGKYIHERGIRWTSDSCVILSFVVGANGWYMPHIMKISPNGQLVFDTILPSLGTGLCRLMDYNPIDKTCIVVNSQTGYETPIYSVTKLDSNYHVVWSKPYQSYYGGNYITDIWYGMRAKGGYVFVGTRDNTSKGWVHKLDFNGNKVWEATYTAAPAGTMPPFNYMYITGIDTLPNGGYVLCGSTDSIGDVILGESWQRAFVMTIDSNGCFSDTACESKFYAEIEYFEPAITVKVYPNPATESFVVTTEHLPLAKSSLVITNQLGQVVVQTKINHSYTEINCSAWSSGIYFWALLNEGQIVRSGKLVRQ